MIKIKNLHPGILVVRLTRGQVLEMQPDTVAFVADDEVLKSEKAMDLVNQNKLKIISAGN